jgi:hypothetical protein
VIILLVTHSAMSIPEELAGEIASACPGKAGTLAWNRRGHLGWLGNRLRLSAYKEVDTGMPPNLPGRKNSKNKFSLEQKVRCALAKASF